MDDDKKLKLMRFWLFGTFVIIFAAATIYVGMFTGVAILTEWRYWVAMAIAALLSVGAFYAYRAFISKK